MFDQIGESRFTFRFNFRADRPIGSQIFQIGSQCRDHPLRAIARLTEQLG